MNWTFIWEVDHVKITGTLCLQILNKKKFFVKGELFGAGHGCCDSRNLWHNQHLSACSNAIFQVCRLFLSPIENFLVSFLPYPLILILLKLKKAMSNHRLPVFQLHVLEGFLVVALFKGFDPNSHFHRIWFFQNTFFDFCWQFSWQATLVKWGITFESTQYGQIDPSRQEQLTLYLWRNSGLDNVPERCLALGVPRSGTRVQSHAFLYQNSVF